MDSSTSAAPSPVISFHGVGSPVQTRNIDEALRETGLDFTVTRHDLMILGRNHETKEDGSPNHREFEPTKVLGGEGSREMLFSQDSDYTGITLPDQVAIVRDDTRQPLCVMGRGYTPLQNRECVSIIEDVLAADDGIEIVHGGNIKNCERMFLALRLPGEIKLGPIVSFRMSFVTGTLREECSFTASATSLSATPLEAPSALQRPSES